MATKINTPIAYHQFATFSVTTDVIAPWKYQWKRNGVNLVHGNDKSYTTPPLRPEDFSAKYTVTVHGQDSVVETSAAVSINDNVKAVTPITDKEKAAAAIIIPPKGAVSTTKTVNEHLGFHTVPAKAAPAKNVKSVNEHLFPGRKF